MYFFFTTIVFVSGEVMHAADLRSMYIFKDKRVLSIGSSYSSEAVVLEAYKHGCKRVVNSYRTNGIGFIRESQSEGIAAEHPKITNIDVIIVFIFN